MSVGTTIAVIIFGLFMIFAVIGYLMLNETISGTIVAFQLDSSKTTSEMVRELQIIGWNLMWGGIIEILGFLGFDVLYVIITKISQLCKSHIFCTYSCDK